MKIWYDAVRESAEMFFLNWEGLTVGFMKFWSVASVVWFLVEMNPLEDSSKQCTLHLYSVISVTKCAYLSFFSLCLVSMCFSEGHVSSNRWISFFRWFLDCYTELWWNWATSWTCDAWKIAINRKLVIHRVHNIVYHTVMSPKCSALCPVLQNMHFECVLRSRAVCTVYTGLNCSSSIF